MCDDGLECRDGACKVPCGRTGFDNVEMTSSYKPIDGAKGTFFLQVLSAEDTPLDVLTLDIRQASPFQGPLGPGTYPFTASKYSKCDICIRLAEDCTNEGCARQYLATEGVLEIQALEGASGPFTAVLRDVLFREAIIDMDWASYVPADGRTWCMDGHELSTDDVRLAVPQPQCVADSTDVLLDQNIGDFSLTNCNGESVSLHSLCGQVKAMWLLLVTAWCPVCNEYAPQAYEKYQAWRGDLGLWVILGENRAGKPPTAQDCLAYANAHGLDPALTFFDPGWETTANHVYPYGFQGIPYDMVLDGSNMAYVWSTGNRGNLGSVLDSLLRY